MGEPTGNQLIAFYQYAKRGSVKGAADALGISPQAVKNRVYRLRANNPEFRNSGTGCQNTGGHKNQRFVSNYHDSKTREKF
jgi:hypothetical protein